MSRSRRDWDKDRRDQLGQSAAQSVAQERAQTDGPSEEFVQEVKGEKLKPYLVEFVRAKRLRLEVHQRVIGIIRRSKIFVLAEEARKDGKTWCECEMRIRDDDSAYIESEQLQFLLNQLAERNDFIGRDWTLYFWFPVPKSPMKE